MPESTQMAIAALGGLGLLVVVAVVGACYNSGPGDLDDFARGALILFICEAAGAWASAILIWLRVPVGQVTGGIVALGAFPFFPIGTGFSVFILMKLTNKETERYLRT